MAYEFSRLCLIGALISGINAHGYVRSHIMDGKTYTGFLPVATPDFTAPPPSIVRHMDNGHHPILNLNSADLACGQNALPITDANGRSRTGQVTAGTAIKFAWGTGFPHAGPAVTYMARCEPDCGKFRAVGDKVWFKAAELGYSNDTWGTEVLGQTGKLEAVVSQCLRPGEYLVRHEITSLPDCAKPGKCQIYISCAQVKVVGGGDVVPSTRDLVSFPGAYALSDKGWKWKHKQQDYQPPGPPLFVCP